MQTKQNLDNIYICTDTRQWLQVQPAGAIGNASPQQSVEVVFSGCFGVARHQPQELPAGSTSRTETKAICKFIELAII